jgi:neurotransmitter:Na+ symporter, NSS family
VFDLLDHVTSNVLLPLGGLGISLFAGWIADERLLGEELGLARAGAARLRWFLRWLVPAGIVAASVAPMFG